MKRQHGAPRCALSSDAAGQVKIKLFLGIGFGEKSTVNIPVSIGGELYGNKP
jgi:hypothetical protein